MPILLKNKKKKNLLQGLGKKVKEEEGVKGEERMNKKGGEKTK